MQLHCDRNTQKTILGTENNITLKKKKMQHRAGLLLRPIGNLAG